MKNNKFKPNFFAIIVRDFLIFALVLLGSFILFFVGLVVFVYFRFPEDFDVPVEKFRQELVAGNFNELAENPLLGQGSYFVVYDEEGKVVYTSDDSQKSIFTPREFEFLPRQTNYYDIVKTTYKGKDNRGYIKIEFGDFEIEKTTHAMVILNQEGQVLFSDLPTVTGQLTDSEVEALTGFKSTGHKMLRMDFIGPQHKLHSVVFFISEATRQFNDKTVLKAAAYVGYAFLAFFVITVIIYLAQLDKKVKTPLMMLDKAISEYTHKSTKDPIIYKGPKEFENIFNSFNTMSIQLEKTEEERKKVQEEKQEMLSDISHDLKTPITIIRGYARAIMDDKVSEDERDEYLNLIYNKSDALAELINTFSEYSKLERADFKLNLEPIDACEFMRNYLIERYSDLEFLGYGLEVEIPEKRVYCEIDVFHMRRVFSNILSNTVKYNEKGTCIFITMDVMETDLRIRIGDNGKGISEELRDTVFKPFTMGDTSRNNGVSSGLGMAIVEKIITAHKGTIQLVPINDTKLSTEYDIQLPMVNKG